MRLAALVVASLPLIPLACLAEEMPPLSGTPVAFTLLPVPSAAGFPSEHNGRVPFDMGEPEGRGYREPAVAVKPQQRDTTVRVAGQRVKKRFTMPWQMGVFQ